MSRLLVIGGGPAGAAMATHLARAGRAVTLVERKDGPHDKVCGEFVSEEAALYLHDLDIDLGKLGAVRMAVVRLCEGRRAATACLPFPAFSASRRVLDEAILNTASASGVEILRGRGVKSLRPQDSGWIAELDDGRCPITTDAFLATGKHDLRGWKRSPGKQDDLVAFKLHWRLSAEETAGLGPYVEIYLFPGGYAGLEPVERGIANLCLVIRKRQLAALGQKWDLLLAAIRSACPHLDRRLIGADPCWQRPLAITSIPYGFVQTPDGGPWRLGDQAAVIPSFSGDGMAIALHSAQLAARYYLSGRTAAQFQDRLARDIARQVGRATLISQALVRPLGQKTAVTAARIFHGLLGATARNTRIPLDCMMRARLEGTTKPT